MGNRATFVLVDEDGYQLYYCEWCGITIPESIFWGPDAAEEFIRVQEPTDEWLNTEWAYGALLLDKTKKVLRICGGEKIPANPHLKRLYLDLLSVVWGDWDIGWAYNGVLDLADHVGYQREKLIAPASQFNWATNLIEEDDPDSVGCVATIKLYDGTIRVIPLYGSIDLYLLRGEHFYRAMRRDAQILGYAHPKSAPFPTGGIHIDEREKTLSFWASHEPYLIESLSPIWKKWKLNWLEDRYEAHIALTNRRLYLSKPKAEDTLAKLDKILFADMPNSADRLIEMIKNLQAEYADLGVGATALIDIPLDFGRSDRRDIFDQAVVAWQER